MTLRLPAHWREEAALAIAIAASEATPSHTQNQKNTSLSKNKNAVNCSLIKNNYLLLLQNITEKDGQKTLAGNTYRPKGGISEQNRLNQAQPGPGPILEYSAGSGHNRCSPLREILPDVFDKRRNATKRERILLLQFRR
jgi:hypothetical protein